MHNRFNCEDGFYVSPVDTGQTVYRMKIKIPGEKTKSGFEMFKKYIFADKANMEVVKEWAEAQGYTVVGWSIDHVMYASQVIAEIQKALEDY